MSDPSTSDDAEAETIDAPITVVVADDHQVVRQGLAAVIDNEDDIELVGLGGSGREAIELVASTAPDVVVIDLGMNDIGGIEAAGLILAARPEVAIVAFTAHREHDKVKAALGAGITGYVVRDSDADEVLRAIREAARGRSHLDGAVARMLLDGRLDTDNEERGPALTPREWEVLEPVENGQTNAMIGRRLGISEKTVKAHLTKIYATIGVCDRAGASRWARQVRARA